MSEEADSDCVIMQMAVQSSLKKTHSILPVISPLLAPEDHILQLLPAVAPVQQFWLLRDRFQSVNLEGVAEFLCVFLSTVHLGPLYSRRSLSVLL